MEAITFNQGALLFLAFLLGLFLGMALLARPKWKRRYKAEAAHREALETENARLRREGAEMDTLRHAAARDEARRREAEVRPA